LWPNLKDSSHLVCDFNGTSGSVEDAATRRNEVRIVIGPRRARRIVETLAFFERSLRIWIRIDKDMKMVERRHQFSVWRTAHPIAENIPRHISDPYDSEGFVFDIDTKHAEMRFHRFPCSTSSNTHGFMVIPNGTTRCKGVTEQVIVFGRYFIGRIREACGALICCNDKVCIDPIVTDDVLTRPRGDFSFMSLLVVSNVQHSAHEGPISVTPGLDPRISVNAGIRQAMRKESAFRTLSHDHSILRLLRLDQSPN